MRPKTLSRILSALSCSLLFGAFLHRTSVKDFAMGREAYLLKQAHHFDTYVVRNAHGPLPGILAALIVLGIIFGLYELFAFVFEKLVSFDAPAPQNQRLGQGF
jgi:hypothetical protein